MFFITYTPWGNYIFNTAPLPINIWLFIFPFMLIMLAMEEARKWLLRSRSPLNLS